MSNNILTHLKTSGYLARPTEYQVIFSVPSYIELDSNLQRRIMLNCNSVDIPTLNVQTVDVDIGGAKTSKHVHSYETPAITIKFYCSEDLLEKRVFDAWISGIFSKHYNNVRYDDEITSDFIIRKLSRRSSGNGNKNTIGDIVLVKAKPISINTTSLDYSASDSLMEVTVQLEYYDFYYT